MFRSASYSQGSDPSLAHNYDKCAHRGLPTEKNYKTIVVVSVYTFATNENYPSCVSLLSDKSRTIKQVSHLTLPVPLVSMALALLLPSSSRTLDTDPCHGPGLSILCTILPHAPLAMVAYTASNFAFPNIDSVVVHGFVKLPAQGLEWGSHVISSPFPMLQPR